MLNLKKILKRGHRLIVQPNQGTAINNLTHKNK